MTKFLKKVRSLVFADDSDAVSLLKFRKKDRPLKKFTERERIQLESEIGATILARSGVCCAARIFNLDKDTWIWYEEVADGKGGRQELTTRYEVQSKGILKIQPNYRYSYLEGDELQNFVLATKEYYERVSRQLYKKDPQTGQPL